MQNLSSFPGLLKSTKEKTRSTPESYRSTKVTVVVFKKFAHLLSKFVDGWLHSCLLLCRYPGKAMVNTCLLRHPVLNWSVSDTHYCISGLQSTLDATLAPGKVADSGLSPLRRPCFFEARSIIIINKIHHHFLLACSSPVTILQTLQLLTGLRLTGVRYIKDFCRFRGVSLSPIAGVEVTK